MPGNAPLAIPGFLFSVSPTPRPQRHDGRPVGGRMDLLDAPVHLGLAPSLLFHATGAVTFVSAGDHGGWDDDSAILYAVEA